MVYMSVTDLPYKQVWIRHCMLSLVERYIILTVNETSYLEKGNLSSPNRVKPMTFCTQLVRCSTILLDQGIIFSLVTVFKGKVCVTTLPCLSDFKWCDDMRTRFWLPSQAPSTMCTFI